MLAAVGVVLREAWGGRGGPDIAGFRVGHVDELPPVVSGEVHFPAGEDIELAVVEPAEAAAVLADDESVPAIADNIDPRHGSARVGDGECLAVFAEKTVLVLEQCQMNSRWRSVVGETAYTPLCNDASGLSNSSVPRPRERACLEKRAVPIGERSATAAERV